MALPALTPDTRPPEEVMVAVDVALLVHVPEPGVADNDMVLPAHTADGPEIDDGNGFTVIESVMLQPEAEV